VSDRPPLGPDDGTPVSAAATNGPRPGAVPDVHPPAQAVRDAVARALAEDLGALGDLTAALVDSEVTAVLQIRARAEGVIAGQRCAEEAFSQVETALDVDWRRPDGCRVAPGDVVAEVTGRLRAILTAERTALNFLGRLSGVASLTRRYVDAVAAVDPTVAVLDTRKTTPGLRALEKAAVRAGGGRNHRSSLSEAVLVKDNHLGGTSIAEAVGRARDLWPGRLVEVECEDEAQVTEGCRAGAGAVLLDNMTPEQVVRCVTLARTEGTGVLVEVSGGVSLETVGAYAAAGPDVISVGALTHSAVALDLGLDLVERRTGAPGG
jgi:nicotinate-nucleotide pyrophosphorylase (carboxylating)